MRPLLSEAQNSLFLACLYLGVGVSSGKTPNVIYMSNPMDPTLRSRLEMALWLFKLMTAQDN